MRDDFTIPNMGEAPANYDKGHINRVVRNVEMTFRTAKSKGPATFTELTAETAFVKNLNVDGAVTINPAGTPGLTLENTGGGAGDVWSGRLIVLRNFAPGILFDDLSSSAPEILMTADSGNLRLYSVDDLTDALTQIFNVSSTGLITTLGQIAFPATQNASTNANTLDDYEEGTWTPVLTFTTIGDLTVAYSAQIGRYVKIGKMVHLHGFINTTTFTWTTATGEMRITGLPFLSPSTGVGDQTGPTELQNINYPAGRTYFNSNIPANVSYVRFVGSGSGVSRASLQASNTVSGTNMAIIFDIFYEAAN